MRSTASLTVVAIFLCRDSVSALIDCDNVLNNLSSSFIGLCNNKWKNLQPLLKPTQTEVGFAWIEYKLEKNFKDASDAQDEIDSSPTPGILAPDNFIYIIDDHHSLCALDFSGYDSTSVTIDVICDCRSLSSMTEFWKILKEKNLVYLNAHPKNQPNEFAYRDR